MGRSSPDYQWAETDRDPQTSVPARRGGVTARCRPAATDASIATAARQLLLRTPERSPWSTPSGRARALLTADALLPGSPAGGGSAADAGRAA